MRFLFYVLMAYLAYKFIKVVVGLFFTSSFDLKNKNSGFNFYSSSPKSKRNNPKSENKETNTISKKDIIDAEFEEIKEKDENQKSSEK